MDFESDPAADFLSREKEELGGIIDDNEEPNFAELSNDDFSLINSEIQEASAQADDLVDDLAGMSFVSTIPEKTAEVPEKIRLWRIETQQKLEEKDRKEQEAKEALRLAAQNEMSDWVAKYNASMEKTKSFNRSNEEAFEKLESPDNGAKNIWESISNLCDFNQRGPKSSKDASRMRSIFLQMKVN